MEYVYLDNSATTEVSEAAKAAIVDALEKYGNPSSVHAVGLEAAALLNDCRAEISAALGGSDGEIIFTGSGTEATNLALRGTALAKKRRVADTIITTDSEHPSVENTLSDLENYGFEIVKIPTKGGELDFDALLAALDGRKIFMATMMLVNNETGALYDVARAFGMIKKRFPEVITHCDAVQGFLKTDFSPKKLGADLVTLSAHKVHGPKGVGALYVNRSLIKSGKISPVIFGGGQENGYRSGTENIPGIAGFAAAAAEEKRHFAANVRHMEELRSLAEKSLQNIDGITLNIPHSQRAPHILNITLPDIKSETMLHFLSSENICVSAGSACSSKNRKHSHALLAFGLTPEKADESLRISFSKYNTAADVERLARALDEGIHRLVRVRR